jgi:hypothetical protein
MKHNMGNADRIIRFLAVIAIAVLYFNGIVSGVVAYALLGIAVIFLLTSMTGTCPLYSLFGISTCPVNKKGEST